MGPVRGSANWQRALGSELVQEFQERGSVQDVIPRRAGIYMWKARLAPERQDQATRNGLLNWLEVLARRPAGEVSDVTLSHFAQLTRLTLRGPGLPKEKVSAFRAFLAKPANRRWTAQYLEDLSFHTPALYVGEASNLTNRVSQHLDGDTHFGAQVAASDEMDFGNMMLLYQVLPSGERFVEIRKAFEYLTATATVAGYTRRPG